MIHNLHILIHDPVPLEIQAQAELEALGSRRIVAENIRGEACDETARCVS